MLYFVRERFPTHRVDITELFGRELIGRGHQIDFVMQAQSADDAGGPHEWFGRTVWVGRTNTGDSLWSRFHRQWLGLWNELRLLSNASSEHYDAIQVRDKFLIGAVAVLLARRRGLKCFFWLSFPEAESQLSRSRDPTTRYPMLSWIRGHIFGWLLYRWILPRCDHAFVQSEQMKRDVMSHGIEASKLTAVPMGVNAEDVRPVRSVKQEGGVFTLAYLGTMIAQRKLGILVDMLAVLRRKGLNVRLIFIGDGETPTDRQKIEAHAARLGVSEAIEITGFVPRQDALRRLEQADAALSPFYPTAVLKSTSPTKLVEYLALGLPVVANDHPEQRLILRECRAGVRVPWGAAYFSRAVAWLFKLGAAGRRRMGEQGQRWVAEHRTYARIADDLERVYEGLVFGRG